MELIIGLILSLLLLIAGLYQLWRPSSKKDKHQHDKKLPLPPGSLRLPFIGENLDLYRANLQGLLWKFMDDHVYAYGDTFKTSLMVVLARPLGNKAAFSNVHVFFSPKNSLCARDQIHRWTFWSSRRSVSEGPHDVLAT